MAYKLHNPRTLGQCGPSHFNKDVMVKIWDKKSEYMAFTYDE
jgi:hypothetical protein